MSLNGSFAPGEQRSLYASAARDNAPIRCGFTIQALWELLRGARGEEPCGET